MTTSTRITFTIILSLSLTFSVFAQNKKIKEIRKKFQTINRDTTYSTLTLNNEEFLEQMTDGGGQLTGYFKYQNIDKIHERIGLSYGVLTREYYLEEGQLIFVFEKEDTFPYVDSLAALDYTKTETAFEGRYYFDNGKLIKTKIKGEKRFPDKLVFDSQTKEGALLASAVSNAELLTEKKK